MLRLEEGWLFKRPLLDTELVGAGHSYLYKKKVSKWKIVCMETVRRFVIKLGIKPPYDPAIPFLGIYPEETKT